MKDSVSTQAGPWRQLERLREVDVQVAKQELADIHRSCEQAEAAYLRLRNKLEVLQRQQHAAQASLRNRLPAAQATAAQRHREALAVDEGSLRLELHGQRRTWFQALERLNSLKEALGHAQVQRELASRKDMERQVASARQREARREEEAADGLRSFGQSARKNE